MSFRGCWWSRFVYERTAPSLLLLVPEAARPRPSIIIIYLCSPKAPAASATAEPLSPGSCTRDAQRVARPMHRTTHNLSPFPLLIGTGTHFYGAQRMHRGVHSGQSGADDVAFAIRFSTRERKRTLRRWRSPTPSLSGALLLGGLVCVALCERRPPYCALFVTATSLRGAIRQPESQNRRLPALPAAAVHFCGGVVVVGLLIHLDAGAARCTPRERPLCDAPTTLRAAARIAAAANSFLRRVRHPADVSEFFLARTRR